MNIVRGADCVVAQLRSMADELTRVFGYAYPTWSARDALHELQNVEGLPSSFVAIQDGSAVGCASLLADDEVAGYEDVGFWLGNLWVAPHARRSGVGRALVDAVLNEARQHNAPSVHLVTDSASAWYMELGWAEAGLASVNGHPFTVMRHDLVPRD